MHRPPTNHLLRHPPVGSGRQRCMLPFRPAIVAFAASTSMALGGCPGAAPASEVAPPPAQVLSGPATPSSGLAAAPTPAPVAISSSVGATPIGSPSSPGSTLARPADAGSGPPPRSLVSQCRRGPMALVRSCAPSDRVGPGQTQPESPEDFLDEQAVAAFFASHHTPVPRARHGLRDRCHLRDVPMGEEPDAVRQTTLVCRETQIEEATVRGPDGGKIPTYRRMDYVVGYAPRGARLVKILDEPILIDQMDKLELEDGPIFELALTVERGRLVVREPEPGACAAAASTLGEQRASAGEQPSTRAWIDFDRRLLDRLCRAAGPGPTRKLVGPAARTTSF